MGYCPVRRASAPSILTQQSFQMLRERGVEGGLGWVRNKSERRWEHKGSERVERWGWAAAASFSGEGERWGCVASRISQTACSPCKTLQKSPLSQKAVLSLRHKFTFSYYVYKAPWKDASSKIYFQIPPISVSSNLPFLMIQLTAPNLTATRQSRPDNATSHCKR